MPKIQPSSAVLPARYIHTNITAEKTKSQFVSESDEETLSAMESEGTLTGADDSEKEMNCDSTVFTDGSLKGDYIFKIKDEAPDSDEDNNSKQQGISTSDTVIKQESLSDHEGDVYSSVDRQCLISNVRIKEEKDPCVTNVCDFQTAVTDSHETVVGNEPVNHVLKSSFVKEQYEGDNSSLKCNNLESPSIDADKHPRYESIASGLTQLVESTTEKSIKIDYDSSSPPISHETNSDLLCSSGYESETCTENMKTPIRPTNSNLQTVNQYVNQTPQNNPTLFDCNSVNNVSKDMTYLKSNQIGNIPTVNTLNTEAVENENDVYLYGGETENTGSSFSLFNSFNSVSSTPSLLVTVDYNEMVSQNSPLYVQTKVGSCVSPKEKVSTLSENESPAKNNIAPLKDKICLKDLRRSHPVKRSSNFTFDADEDCLPRDLIEYSKIYLNFSKSGIKKSLDFVSEKESSILSIHPIVSGSDRVKETKSSIFPIVSAEIVNTPCVKEVASPLFNTEDVAGMAVEENATVKIDSVKISDPYKCSELPSTEKSDNDISTIEFSPVTHEVKSYTESVGTVKEKINIKYDNFQVCDQNAEVPSSEKSEDLENSDIDFKLDRVLSEVKSYEAVLTNKEKSNIEYDSFKVRDQHTHSVIQSSQNDDDEDERFNRIMAEIIRDASQMKTRSESISCKTDIPTQPVVENTPIITPSIQNEIIPIAKIKQEKMDSMSGTDSLSSGIANTSVQSDPKLFSEENTLPSVEDLQKIIKTSLLKNPLLEIKPDPLNLSPKDVKIKVEQPEIEEITLDDDIPLSSNIIRTQSTHCSDPVIPDDDDIKILVIKRKRDSYKKTINRAYNFLTKKKKDNLLQRTVNRLSNRSGCTVNNIENSVKENRVVLDNFNIVNVSCKSNTFKTAARLHGMNSAQIDRFQQNTDNNTVEEAVTDTILNDIVVKIENIGDFSSQSAPNDISKETSGTSSSSSKRTVYVLNQPEASLNSYKETPAEPLVKKMKNTPLAHVEREEKHVSADSFTLNESSNSYLACKRKADDETVNVKKIKSEEEEQVKTSFPNCNDDENLGRALVSLDKMLPSAAPFEKHTLSNTTLSLLWKAKEIVSSASDFNDGSGTFSNVTYSKESSSEYNCRKSSKSTNEISSCDVNIQTTKPTEKSLAKFHTSSSNRNSNIGLVVSTNATCSKASVHESKNQNSLKLKPKIVSSESDTQPTNSNPGKIHSNDVRFLPRRNKDFKSFHARVGKNFVKTNDFPSLILEWNASWLVAQRKIQKCAPICEDTYVKDSYETGLEYYNTYFPLHLLSIWLGISESWKKCPPSFDSVFENQVKKTNHVKVSLTAVLDTKIFHNWPKREDIVLCSTIKKDGSEENLFGRICSVMARDYDPPADSCLKDEACTLKKVRFDLFCAEMLDVHVLTIVKVQVLSNMRIALLQNDALQLLNSSMKDIILNPKKCISQWKFIALCASDKFTLEKSMKNIFEAVTSDAVKITVVDTPTPADGISAIMQLTTDLVKQSYPVLIGLKNEEAFLKLANSMKRFNPILAIKKREVNLPEELRSFTLEERSVISRDIFQSCHVALTLLSSVFLGDFTQAFSNRNWTCILHEAHLCAETETALLLYYDVKNLVLFGNQEAQTYIHPLLKMYGYDVSLFHRFCRVMSTYASF